MNFPLPAKPGTHHPAPLPPPSLSSLVPSLPEASTSQTTLNGLLPSSVDPTICSVCSLPAKYTCPRCSTRTCSLDCSKTHKVKSSCSGERDPTKYVSLSKVGQGAWADDYRWLEEGRRKVAEWGNALPRDLMRDVVSHERGRGRGGMRGRGGKRRGGRDQGRFMLERELAKTGIHVTFMPEGMERKKKNQSAWNPKTQTLHLTIQLVLQPGVLPPQDDMKARTISHSKALLATSKPQDLPTLSSLLPLNIVETSLVLALPYLSGEMDASSNSQPGTRLFFPPLDQASPLSQALRGTSFIEFPTIQVFTLEAWTSILFKGLVKIMPFLNVQEPRADGGKRKRAIDDPDGVKPRPAPAMSDGAILALGSYESDLGSESDGVEESGQTEGKEQVILEEVGSDQDDEADSVEDLEADPGTEDPPVHESAGEDEGLNET